MCDFPDVKVASLSYSGAANQLRREAASYCKSKRSLMVTAAGNSQSNMSSAGFADNDDLIVVGATTNTNTMSTFSNFGTYVDVMAPGTDVFTTEPNGYGTVSGTSFSCPLTAGLVALIWSANPDLTPNDVEAILKESANVPQASWGSAYGVINSRRALELTASRTLSVRAECWALFPLTFYLSLRLRHSSHFLCTSCTC